MKSRNFLHLLFDEREMSEFEQIWNTELIRFNEGVVMDPWDFFNPKHELIDKLKEIMPTKVEKYDDEQLKFLADELFHEFF